MGSEASPYAVRYHAGLDQAGGHYSRHVDAMTRFGLHSKSDIAGELAWRDYRIAELERALSRHLAPEEAAIGEQPSEGGYIVANGQKTAWRCWGVAGPEWTSYRDQALRFARKLDAETFAREDSDAWSIEPYDSDKPGAQMPNGEHVSVPVVCDFNSNNVVGELRLLVSELPASPNYCFALGYQSQGVKIPGGVQFEPDKDPYTLLAVSMVSDGAYYQYLKQIGYGSSAQPAGEEGMVMVPVDEYVLGAKVREQVERWQACRSPLEAQRAMYGIESAIGPGAMLAAAQQPQQGGSPNV